MVFAFMLTVFLIIPSKLSRSQPCCSISTLINDSKPSEKYQIIDRSSVALSESNSINTDYRYST